MHFDPLSRRMFLRAAGGGLLSIPLLSSLLPRKAAAQVNNAAPPQRFVMFTNTHGSNEGLFFGAMKGKRSTLSLDVANGNALLPSIGHRALADIPGDISYLLAPFTALKSKISVLRSLDVMGAEGGAHPMTFPSCGVGMGPSGGGYFNKAGQPSLDWLIAQKIYGGASIPDTRRQLVLSPEYNLEFKNNKWVERGFTSASYRLDPTWNGTNLHQRAVRISAVANTQTLMQKFVFDPGATQTMGFDRKAMLDRVYESYRRVSTDTRLSAEDRRKLDAYLSLVGELQHDVAPPAAMCEPPTLEDEPPYIPNEGTEESRRAIEDLRIRNHIRIVTAAMLCDLTRVAAISVYAGSHTYHHASSVYSHSATSNAEATKFWGEHLRIAKMVAALMTSMDQYRESNGGTLLDNSIVYWAQQYATLYTSGGAHSSNNMPVVLGGGAAGKLRMGQFIDYRTSEGPTTSSYLPRGAPLNNLLVTIMNCFGLTSADYEVSPGLGMGSYDGSLGIALADEAKTIDARRSALPFLYQGTVRG